MKSVPAIKRDSPRISVVVPNYNHGRFLPRRLESILNQSFADFEVLFLDDASTDNSMMVYEEYGTDPRIQLMQNSQNSGSPFKQWNKGIKHARGKYIWVAESDDYADPTLLRTLLNMIEGNPGTGVAYCQSWLVNEFDQITQRFDDYDSAVKGKRWQNGFACPGEKEIREHLAVRNTIPNASAVLFEREAFIKAGCAPEHLRLCGDWLTWVRLLMHCDIAFHPEPLNYFRIDQPTSQRVRAKTKALDVFEGIDVFQEISNNLDLTEQEYVNAFQAHLSRWAMYAVAYRYSLELNQSIYRKFSEMRDQSGFDFPFKLGRHFFRQASAQVGRMVRK